MILKEEILKLLNGLLSSLSWLQFDKAVPSGQLSLRVADNLARHYLQWLGLGARLLEDLLKHLVISGKVQVLYEDSSFLFLLFV